MEQEKEDIGFADFIVSSIHDMKNSVSMQVDVLERISLASRQRGDVATVEGLGEVIYEANRMNANLIQLLGLYKLGNAIYPMNVVETSIGDLIEEAVLRNKSIMDFKGIAIAVDCDPECYWFIDADLVMGILINALSNAYKYTADKIRVAARIEGGFLELRVEDNGQGYPSDMLRDGGVLADKGVDFSIGSTGLGFHFASRAAGMHKNGDLQGALVIENGGAYGGGCFVVRLP
jgi:signal transduction histidine kinase